MDNKEVFGLVFALIIGLFFPPIYLFIGVIYCLYWLFNGLKLLTLKIVPHFHGKMGHKGDKKGAISNKTKGRT